MAVFALDGGESNQLQASRIYSTIIKIGELLPALTYFTLSFPLANPSVLQALRVRSSVESKIPTVFSSLLHHRRA